MSASHLLTLLFLAAIWGGSFLFLRIAVPVLGPVWVVELRILLSALTLLAVAMWHKRSLDWRRDGHYYLIIGGLNAALPFGLFAWAAQHTTASMLSILNATTPIWGAVLTALWMRAPLTFKTLLGLALGVAGVTALVGFEGQAHGEMTVPGLLSVLAGVTAALSYGVAATFARVARPRDALDTAHGSAWGAMLWLLLALPFAPPIEAVPQMHVIFAVLLLGIVGSGLAYIFFYRLIEQIGTAPTLSVTFLIPVFGVFWGAVFLKEPVGWPMLFGAAMVLIGTALITGFSPRSLLKRRAG